MRVCEIAWAGTTTRNVLLSLVRHRRRRHRFSLFFSFLSCTSTLLSYLNIFCHINSLALSHRRQKNYFFSLLYIHDVDVCTYALLAFQKGWNCFASSSLSLTFILLSLSLARSLMTNLHRRFAFARNEMYNLRFIW